MKQASKFSIRGNWILWLLLCLVLLLPLSGELYYVKLVTRMLIFAIAALSLDLLVGYMGQVSFGHAAFMAIGAYCAGMLAGEGWTSVWVVWPLAMLAGAVFALIVGAVSLRCSGLYFIFITLAFSQMLYYGAQSLRSYGGDDGFSMDAHNQLAAGLDMGDPVVLFYTSLALLLVCLYLGRRLIRSPFGQIAIASRDNEVRLASVGVRSYPYKLLMFVISGAMCALSGALLANLTSFIAPGYMTWLVSGELLVMVILGSVGTLVGPVLGAAVFIGFEHVLSDWTEHWMLIFGPLIVIRVLFLKDGLYGLVRGRKAEVVPVRPTEAAEGGA